MPVNFATARRDGRNYESKARTAFVTERSSARWTEAGRTETKSGIIRYKCSLRLVTPAIVAGFDQTRAELHWAAIRGNVRRFHRLIDPGMAMESRIFGGTTKETGQSLWLLRSREATLTSEDASKLTGPKYFTWPLSKRGHFRPHGDTTLPITFDIIFRPEAEESDRRRVRDAFRLWSLWGGLGARTRRGFGSVSLEMVGPPGEPTIPAMPADVDGWLAAAAGELGSLATQYGVTWRHRWLIGPPVRSWEDALQGVAASMAAFRGYRNRPDEGTAPETVRFGLPVTLGIGTFTGEKHDRSASSVWIRVIRLGNRYCASVVYMPTPFLPPGERVGGPNKTAWDVPAEDVLTKFMDELATPPGWQEVMAHG